MLALELSRFKIRVNVICPGSVKTRIVENTWRRNTEAAKIPAVYPNGTIPLTGNVPAVAEDIARMVAFLCSDAARHITGTPIWIDGGQSLLI
jgi:NAD(P)-dependent dehydrogenase (short-subunit alcohol dehydrogenase family)